MPRQLIVDTKSTVSRVIIMPNSTVEQLDLN